MLKSNTIIGKIVRTRRKTIALVITQDAELIVRVPLKIPLSFIERAVNKRSEWINRKIAEIKSRPRSEKRQFVTGGKFFYLGQQYELQIVTNQHSVFLKEKLCVPEGSAWYIKSAIEKWYKKRALALIGERCKLYSKIVGSVPASIRITNAQKRWGSCGVKKKVNFSWRLIMAPIEVIDYVVVHELAHLEQLNHSRLFWNKVKSLLPDFKTRQQWLRKNEGFLRW